MAKKVQNEKKLPYRIQDSKTIWNKEKEVDAIILKLDEDTQEKYETFKNIGTIIPVSYNDEEDGYAINKIKDYSFNKYPLIKYPDEKSAAEGLYSLWLHLSDLRNQNTTNDNVLNYLDSEIRNLFSEKRRLDEMNSSFHIKISQLRYFVELFNIKSGPDMFMLYPEDDIQRLLDFKTEDDKIFLSEDCLYDKFGKEDARSIMSLIKKLIKKIDPTRSI